MKEQLTEEHIPKSDSAAHSTGSEPLNLVHEVILTIRTEDRTIGQVSCTPSDLTELMAGWLFTETDFMDTEELVSVSHIRESRTLQVTLKKKQNRHGKTAGRKGVRAEAWEMSDLLYLNEVFRQDPPLFARTGASHSCILARHTLSGGIDILYRGEDAGRHSAMDKTIGWALLHDVEPEECILFCSGRISTHMAMKAAKAGVSALAGRGVVTAEAVEIARDNSMALIGCMKWDHPVIFYKG